MIKVSVPRVLAVFGALFLLAGVGQTGSADGDITSSFSGGIILLLGALAYTSRDKQRLGASKVWVVLEVVALAFILLDTILAVTSGGWYDHPVRFLAIPIVVWLSWLSVFKKKP